MKILHYKRKKAVVFLLLIGVYLFSLRIYSDIPNTTEITVKPTLDNIDKLLEEEISKNAEYKSPEELLKKANDLLNLIDYFKERKEKNVIEKIMLSVEEIYKEGLSKYPDYIKIYDDYGAFLYDYKGDYINSVRLWEQGYKLNEKDASINNNLALHYFHIGEYDRGWEHLQNALKYGESEPNILYNSAQIFIIYRNQIQERTGWNKEKIYKKAMDYSEKAAKISPDDFELLKDYALNFFTAAQFDLPIDGKKSAFAWQSARKHARNDDEVFYTWVNEGRAWLSINELKKARECLVEAIKIRPDSVVVKDILLRIDSGEIKENIEEQKKAKNKPPEEEYRNPLISPFKNFSGKKNKTPLYPQQIKPENKKN